MNDEFTYLTNDHVHDLLVLVEPEIVVEDGFLREQGIESTELFNSLGIFAISR